MPRRSREKDPFAPCGGGVGRRDQRWHARRRSGPRAAGTAFPGLQKHLQPPQRGYSLTPRPPVTVSFPGGSGPAPPLRKGWKPSLARSYCASRAVPPVPGLAGEGRARAGTAALRPPCCVPVAPATAHAPAPLRAARPGAHAQCARRAPAPALPARKDNAKVNGLSGPEPPGLKSGGRSSNWGKRNFGSARSQPIGHLPRRDRRLNLKKRTAPAD
ncbi:uncharacterized protein [Taeniopygia guttata]|uniref:uncharacterized protein n=1 Tax=Taeniopygia guttata TaxID=59729 RepID=UPI003BB996AF